ncbi:sensor histidine kinase [Azospirillum sp. sgz301742]
MAPPVTTGTLHTTPPATAIPAAGDAPDGARPRTVRLGPLILAASVLILTVVGALFVVIAYEQRNMRMAAQDSHDRVAPMILERQRAAVNLERFKRYGAITVNANQPRQRREALLSAQALAYHPSFLVEPALSRQMTEAYGVLRQASALQDEAERRRAEAGKLRGDAGGETDGALRREAAELDLRADAMWQETIAALDVTADRLSVDVSLLTAGRFAEIRDSAQWVSAVVFGGFLAVFTLLALAVWMARRHIVRPVLRAARALTRISDGERGVRLPAGRTMEMNTIFRAVESLDRMVDDLRTAQSHLVQTEKMVALGSLVAGVAHEINSPLGVAVTAASLLADRTRDLTASFEAGQMRRADFEEYLRTATEVTGCVQGNLDRAARLVSSFKQVAVDQASEDHRSFALKAYIDEVMQSLSVSLRKAGLEVRVECPADIEVEGFPGAFGQLLTNLAMNSMLHAYEPGQHGRLTLAVRAQDDQVELRFSDDGQGIPEDVQARIFEPFYTTARGRGSTGLGLHIVFNLVTQRLRGRIAVESAPDEGTTFVIRFPRCVPPE